MERTAPDLASALLQWVNTFPLPRPVRSWNDIADGHVVWRMLTTIDEDHFQSALPESERQSIDNWIPRWQNWKHIEKEVLWYIKEECGRLPGLGRSMHADLKAIATESSDQEIMKIIKCVLLAAMYSDKSNQQMVEVMSSLGSKVAQPIATFLSEMEELDETMVQSDEDEAAESADGLSADEVNKNFIVERDLELERESKLIHALQDKKRTEAQLADALAELQILQKKQETLNEELEESKHTLDRQRGAKFSTRDMAQLNERADKDRDYIERLETDLADATATADQRMRQIDRLTADADSRQTLKDELQVATNERDELRQKAKVNENLRKKIQILQEQEKTTQLLRHDLQHAQEQLQEVELLKDRCLALEKANEENSQTIANGEQELFDQKTAKRMLEHELQNISHRWEQSKELLIHAQETIRDMEERMQEERHGVGDGSGADLDTELQFGDRVLDTISPDASKAQDKSWTVDIVVLQQKLAITTASVIRLEKRCLDLLQENLGYKSIITDTAMDSNADSHPFHHQSQRLEALSAELEKTKSQCIQITTQALDLQHRLQGPDSQNAADQAALLTLSETQKVYALDLEQTIRDQRALLRHALLSAAATQREDATERASSEWKLWKHRLEMILNLSADESQVAIISTATSITDRIEDVRGVLAARDLNLSERDTEVLRLQEEIKGLKLQTSTTPVSATADAKEHHKQIRQLRRENQLIASAWYDLTCRLQSNNVHLTRRADSSRGWLAKMRTAVNTSTLPDRTTRV